jgi:hypothetical protein
MEKEIRIYDTSNQVLKVKGIRFDLFDAVTGALVSTDLSRDLNPGVTGIPSNDWGVRLSFNSGKHPLDMCTSDPNHSYPGGVIESLEGSQSDRIDIDLLKLPGARGGQSLNLSSGRPVAVSNWIEQSLRWIPEEKRAVRHLVFNYLKVIVPRLPQIPSEYQQLKNNWGEALRIVGINPDILEDQQMAAA